MSFSNVITGAAAANRTATPASGKEVQAISTRYFGEGIATSSLGPWIYAPVAVTPATTKATELFNSRSPAIGTNLNDATGPTGRVVLLSAIEFSYQAWSTNNRTKLVAGNVAGNNESLTVLLGGAITSDITSIYAESQSPITRSVRRQSRKGYCFNLGNDVICNHQKTGTGAFQMHVPHFCNDCLWVAPVAWRNGMNQSDVWNIQLFGTVATPNVRVGRQRAHAM